jgi:hypothetical protein
MKSINGNLDPHKVLRDDLLYISAVNSYKGILICIILVIVSLLIFGRIEIGEMKYELNWQNIYIFYYSLIPVCLLTLVLFILSYYRFQEIKTIIKKGKIVRAEILSIEGDKESEIVAVTVAFECSGKMLKKIKRIKGYRVQDLLQHSDFVKIIINPEKPKYIIFYDLYI